MKICPNMGHKKAIYWYIKFILLYAYIIVTHFIEGTKTTTFPLVIQKLFETFLDNHNEKLRLRQNVCFVQRKNGTESVVISHIMKPKQIFISIEKYVINATYYSFFNLFASFYPLICVQNVYTTMHDLKAIYSVICLEKSILIIYCLLSL